MRSLEEATAQVTVFLKSLYLAPVALSDLLHFLQNHLFLSSRNIFLNWDAIISKQVKKAAAAQLSQPKVSSAGEKMAFYYLLVAKLLQQPAGKD